MIERGREEEGRKSWDYNEGGKGTVNAEEKEEGQDDEISSREYNEGGRGKRISRQAMYPREWMENERMGKGRERKRNRKKRDGNMMKMEERREQRDQRRFLVRKGLHDHTFA